MELCSHQHRKYPARIMAVLKACEGQAPVCTGVLKGAVHLPAPRGIFMTNDNTPPNQLPHQTQPATPSMLDATSAPFSLSLITSVRRNASKKLIADANGR